MVELPAAGGSMFVRIAVACLLAAPLGHQEQEKPKIPKDSIQVVVNGCLKGRVLAASNVRQTDIESGVEVRQHSFRLTGKKDLMKEVKADDGQRVQVTGLIRKSDLYQQGMRFKGGRVVIGGGKSSGSPSGSQIPDPVENVAVMDVTNVQPLGGSCGK
jgi:hypothetical protein